MESSHNLASTCRCCQHYSPEGRRGGQCSQLHVPVKGGWSACQLAIPAFAMSWEVEPMLQIQHQSSTLGEITSAEYHLMESLDPVEAQPSVEITNVSV